MNKFRRPASLSLHRQEQLLGDPDPADTTDLAHASANAILNQVRQSQDSELVERVIRIVQTEGIDDIAALWSHSPAPTLPGALWRLYALHAWVHDSPEKVVARYEAGIKSAPGLRYLAGVEEPPTIDSIRVTLDEIMRGVFSGDFAIALERAAAVLTLSAYGTAHLAEQAEANPVASSTSNLTQSAERLLTTADELSEAAELMRKGELS